ncbi:MAG TPA: ACT domain-containing protein [Anaerolineae bacterium]|nr:ACT domain-containing protein [Anaerolineae bacterium]
MLTLSILPDTFAICRLGPAEDVPEWAMIGEFVSITHTSDELSIVCAEENVPADVKADRGWRALKVEGQLDLALTGVLASLANPLAEAQINLFAISTFDTDCLLVKGYNLKRACDVLQQAGQVVTTA